MPLKLHARRMEVNHYHQKYIVFVTKIKATILTSNYENTSLNNKLKDK